MEPLTNNQKYNASIILNFILRDDSNESLNNGNLCNAIRLCLGKRPYKNNSESFRDGSKYNFLNEKNAANDVY